MATVSPSLRRQIREQARGLCEYCRCPESHSTQNFSVDHIWPQSREGSDEAGNLALACQGCNNKKYDKTSASDPATGIETPLFNPREHRWDDHFTWDETEILVLGLTATGRATIAALDLNRQSVLNLRTVLVLAVCIRQMSHELSGEVRDGASVEVDAGHEGQLVFRESE